MWAGVDVCALARLSAASEEEGQHVYDSRAVRAGALQGTGLRVVPTMPDQMSDVYKFCVSLKAGRILEVRMV